jgi:hypothetical protein
MVEMGLEYFAKPSRQKVVLKPNLIVAEPLPTTRTQITVTQIIPYFLVVFCILIN